MKILAVSAGSKLEANRFSNYYILACKKEFLGFKRDCWLTSRWDHTNNPCKCQARRQVSKANHLGCEWSHGLYLLSISEFGPKVSKTLTIQKVPKTNPPKKAKHKVAA
jgi:hypothetical protein